MWLITFSIIGLTFILRYGSILVGIKKALRDVPGFEELFKCPMCLGFWSGLAHGIFLERSDFIMLAFYGSVMSFVADVIVELLQTIIIRLDRKS